ncbi:hypothetical protein H0H87_006819 [Tephrocybe sp. NHM501043]|nr:hypothetical protein H0H87_006819 [Tephrocybe sp. NHM501043]
MSSTPGSASSISPPPSKMPPPTGNWFVDAYQSVAHIGDMPCARNSLLSGIGGGFGIGVVRGLSASAFVAGNWACAAFIVISLGSLCVMVFVEQHRCSISTETAKFANLKWQENAKR